MWLQATESWHNQRNWGPDFTACNMKYEVPHFMTADQRLFLSLGQKKGLSVPKTELRHDLLWGNRFTISDFVIIAWNKMGIKIKDTKSFRNVQFFSLMTNQVRLFCEFCANQWCAPATRWQQALECKALGCCIYFSLKWALETLQQNRTQGLHNASAVWCSEGCEFTLCHSCQHISEVLRSLSVLALASNCLRWLLTHHKDNKAQGNFI